MIPVSQAIVVEGRYDKNKLSQIFDAVILDIGGYGIFKDKEKLALLRRLARGPGLLILTDSDSAGFVIRNYLKGAIPGRVWHAYIPPVAGKEKRKSAPGKEGLLGVEGVDDQMIIDAVRRSGALAEKASPRGALTRMDLYDLGLSGGQDSRKKREALCRALELPRLLSTAALVDVLNAIMTAQELQEILGKISPRQTHECDNAQNCDEYYW